MPRRFRLRGSALFGDPSCAARARRDTRVRNPVTPLEESARNLLLAIALRSGWAACPSDRAARQRVTARGCMCRRAEPRGARPMWNVCDALRRS